MSQSEIIVQKYEPKQKNVWNEFLDNSKNSTFLFNRNFVEYHADRFNDYSLIIIDKGEIVTLFPANIDANRIVYSHQGLTYGGFVFREDECLNDILKYIHAALRFFKKNDISKILYKSIPKFYNTIGSDEIDYSLFLLEAKLIRRDTALTINLKNKISYQNRRIRSIKKATKLGVFIIEQDSFQDFWHDILIPNLLERFGVNPVHSLEEIEMLAKYFPKNIKQFNAYLDDRIVAGTTIFETPNVAHAQYISASTEGRNNGGLDLLFSHLIEKEFAHKNYFDFGISNENKGKSLNHGLLDWKEGFGGRSFSHDFYEIETIKYRLLESVIKW
jgi:hypothetical protein